MNGAVLNRYPHILKVKKDPSAYEEDTVDIRLEVAEEDVPQSVEAYERNWTLAKEYPLYSERMERWHRDHIRHD